MSKSKRERIYDEQIAPLMTQIIDICKREGFGISGFVELTDEFTVLVHAEPEDRHTARMRMAYYLLKADGNIDLFLTAVQRDAKKHGHSSMYLRLLEMHIGQT